LGLNVLMVDHQVFPRDKVCGDAISGKSVDVLRRLDLLDALSTAEQVSSRGIVFGSPGEESVAIPFGNPGSAAPPGYVCARAVFDNLLFQEAVRSGVHALEQTRVRDLLTDGDTVTGVTLRQQSKTVDVRARVTIGSDGAYSVVARRLGFEQILSDHYCAGVRTYCSDVTGFHAGNYIELHFVRELLPGYFWIFPMAHGRANVGVGMLSSQIKRTGMHLTSELMKLIQHSRFSSRFGNGAEGDTPKGWGLPLGSRPRRMSGSGWMLAGDAASLIDPFTGEGIGNAMVSGERAAEWARRAHEAGRFDREFLAGYESDVLSELQDELHISHKLQKLVRHSWLFNLVVRKARRSEFVADTISSMFDDESKRKRLMSPMFYLRLLGA
jgi:geranylgeranyl reductase family protein